MGPLCVGQTQYAVTNLGALGMTDARGLNNLGQAVGGGANGHARLYKNGVVLDLGTNTTTGMAINDAGQVVGRFSSGGASAHVFMYDGAFTDLGTFGGSAVTPTAINNNGEIVGNPAILYSGGAWTNILHPLFSYSPSAADINSSRQIVINVQGGQVEGAYVYTGAYGQNAGVPTATMGFGGITTHANAINESGQVVGYAEITRFGGVTHAFLYSGGVTTDLGTLGGASSAAYGVNNQGQIVGRSTTSNGTTRPFIYSGGVMRDLGSTPDLVVTSLGWDITLGALRFTYTNAMTLNGPSLTGTPIAINDQGQILFSGGILLTPIAPVATSAKLYWATNVTISAKLSNTPIFTHTIPAGFTGGSAPVQVSASNLQNRPTNATHVLLVLNPDNLMPESNTNNNTAALNITLPDLLAAGIAWNAADGGLSFAYTVQPGTTARAATSAELFWATGTAASNKIGGSIFSQPIPAVFSGQSSNINVSASFLSNPPTNATHVLLVVDSPNLVTESSEDNNVAAASLALPDLLPNSFNWSAGGRGLDFSYTVRTGFVAIAATTAKVFWANGPGTPIFTADIPAGANGPSAIMHVPEGRLTSPPNGATWVLLALDPDNLVKEGNETNNILAIDYENEPTELSGRVLDAVNRSPIEGANVSVGGRSATTSAAGEYVISGVPTVVTNTLVVTKTGYSTNPTKIIVPPRMPKKVVPDIFLAPDGAFVMTAIEPEYDGLFLWGVEFTNEYTARVAWGDRTPGRVDFYVNDVLMHSVPTSGETATASIDVGRFEGLHLGRNEVTAIAIDSGGTSSSPFEQVITTIPAPALLYPSIGQLAPRQFSGGTFTFEFQFPAKEIGKDAYKDLGLFGRFGETLGFGGAFSYRLSDGKWELSLGSANNGKWEKPLLHVYESTLESKAYVYGGGTATMAGIELTNVGFKVMFTYDQKLWELQLSRIVPAALWFDYVNWLVQTAGADMSSIAKVNIYGQVNSEVSIEADARNWPVKYKDTTFSLDIGARASYEPDFYVAKGEITLGGSLGGKFEINPNVKITESGFKVYGKVGLTVKNKVVINLTFVIVEGSKTNWLLDASSLPAGWQFIPIALEEPSGYLETAPEVFVANRERSEISENEISPLEEFRCLGRSTAEGNTPKPQGYDPSDLSGYQADVTLIENVHADASPALATRGAEMMLLYLSASETTNPLLNTDIKWTRWDGTNWSAPEAIRTNSQAEFCPQVKFDGNGDAIAVWERVADPNLTNADLTVMLSQLEIVWSRWSRISRTWSEPAALSANNYLDHSPRLCGPMSNGDVLLVWTKNQANLLMGRASPSNDIAMWSEWHTGTQSWSTPQVLLDNLTYRLSDSLAGSSNVAVYAWATDTDGILTNGVDQEVLFVAWTNGAWDAVQQLTSNNIPDRNIRAGVSGAGTPLLVWQSGTNLLFNRGLSGTNQLVRPNTQSAGFTDYVFTIGPSNNLVLVWQEMSTSGYDPHYMVYDPVSDAWGNEDLLLNDLPREGSFAAAWDDAGNLVVAYEKVQITYTNKTVTLTNGETLVIPNVPEAGRVDLAVSKRSLIKDLELADDDFTVEGANYLPGGQLTLTATVRNIGNLAISNIVVDFFSGNPAAGGVLVASGNSSGWLAAATTAVVSAKWIIPEPATNYTVYAVANRTGLAGEFDPSNNIASVKIGGTDLAVSLVSKVVETNGAVRIVAQVQNLGAPTATNCTLAIRRSRSTNAPLATVEVPSLRPGRTAEFALQLPPGTHAPGESLYTLGVDEVHANSDVDTNNNQATFAVMLLLDSDGDGMADHWEIANGLNPYDPSDALGDPDQDGLSNLEEYKQGKNPGAFDNLRVVTSQRLSNGQFQLTALVERGRNYTLEASTNLVDWESILAFFATNSPVTLVDPTASNLPQRFYRLRLSSIQPPKITGQPANSTNIVGTPASFNVTANGTAPLACQWRKGGANLSNQTNATLTFPSVAAGDAGNFDVVVTNNIGSVTSAVATLTVVIPTVPAMDFMSPSSPSTDASYSMGFEFDALQPITVTALGMFDAGTNGFAESHDVGIFNSNGTLLASTTVFSTNQLIGYFRYQQIPPLNLPAESGYRVAAVTGTEPFTWSPSGPTTNALIRFVRDRYTSYATDLVFPTSSDGRVGYFGANFLLTDSTVLPDPPVITTQPTNQNAAVGATATFTVVANGAAPLAYRWRKDGVSLNDGANIGGATAATLWLTNVSAASAGNYDVVVTNTYGSVTSQLASLTVLLPSPRLGPASRSPDSFAMGVSGTPGGTVWILRSFKLVPPWTPIGTLTLDANGTATFIDTNPPASGAFYRASTVLPALPAITIQPTNRNATVGATATFTVAANGAAPLGYLWRKGGAALINSANLSGTTGPTLSITDLQLIDSGDYDVVVTNYYGGVTSQFASLNVVTPASGAPAMDFAAPGNLYTDASYSMGFEFDALQAITVTALGMYDDDTNGFAESHDVGIFSTNGLLLAYTTVFSTNQLIGYFRYQQIPPLSLPAASGYRVAAVTGTERFTWAPSGPTTNSLIRFVRDRWTPFATSLVLPSSSDGRVGYFGANFLLTTSTNQPP